MAEIDNKKINVAGLKAFGAKIVAYEKGITDAIDTKVNTLVGSDSNKSVRTIANEELVAQLIPAAAKESLDTLGEIAAWIQAHPDDASAMNNAIVALQGIVAGIGGENDEFATITAYVQDAIADLSLSTELAKKVDKVEGKSLILDTEITRLDGIETGAQVNIIETVKVDGTALSVEGKAVNVDLSGKVDKETGKSLIADSEIARLANMKDGANKAEVSAETFTAGTKVATVTIDGSATEIKVPTVAVSAALTEGVEVGTVTINGTATKLYIAAEQVATVAEVEAMFDELVAPKA